jgi:hypothetical protein
MLKGALFICVTGPVTFHKPPPDRFCVDRYSAATRLQQTDTAGDISAATAACGLAQSIFYWQYPPATETWCFTWGTPS